MKKRLLLSLCVSSLITMNLNAEEVVNLSEDSKLTQALAKPEAIENHDVQFSLEVGSKIDFWDPGLSKEDGQDLLDYDTEGLFLGYATLKTKIYGTDVFTLEKFSTLLSSPEQKELLSEYKADRKEGSSLDGYKVSIQLMKVLNYLFDTNILNGLEYKYQTRNFIGEAKLADNALYWFGTSPGLLDIDYNQFQKGSKLSFQTKFTDSRILYNFTSKDVEGMSLYIGAFHSEWSKPAYIGTTSREKNLPLIFPAKYEITGASIGLKSEGDGLNFNVYLDYGIDNNMILNNGRNFKDTLNEEDSDLVMVSYGLDVDYTFPNIYSSHYFNLDFIISGNVYSSNMQANPEGENNSEIFDEELLYGINAAFEVRF